MCIRDSFTAVMAAVHALAPAPHDPFLSLLPPQGVKLTPKHYAYLKISEGCNHRCTFCIIPSLRGDLVSRPLGAVLDERDHLREELKDQRATFARELAEARASWDEWLSYMNTRMAQPALPAPEADQQAQDQGKRRPGLLGRLLGR